MTRSSASVDYPTVAAIAILSAMTVIVSHEALGHGSSCLAAGGRVKLLTTSLFRCDAPSVWISLMGPATNLAIGVMAAITAANVKDTSLRLFLILVAAFALFWEGGYAVKAMLTGNGDLYEFARAFIAGPQTPWRAAIAGMGVLVYCLGARWLSDTLCAMWSTSQARTIARTAWMAATTATCLAALAYKGGVGANLRDTFLEIGVASLPLLILPLRRSDAAGTPFGRKVPLWATAIICFIAVTLTMGYGIG